MARQPDLERRRLTEQIFQTEAYVRDFEATVVRVDEAGGVVLDRTAFFPGGGGQPHDLGTLHAGGVELPVTSVRRAGADIVHVLQGTAPAPGTPVRGVLDWPRRHALMRTHTSLQVLCGVIWRDHGAQVTGGNMEPLRGRLDFELEGLNAELVSDIEARINAEVQAAREVVVRILPREQAEAIPDLIRTKINLLPPGLTEIRTVDIVGLDLQADGGTHVANTREVGAIKIADYRSKGRLNKRLVLELQP